jgi:hypothetical protein
VYVELKSGTSVYQRVLSPPVPDTWMSYMVSLASFSEGGWSVKQGSPGQFAQALTHVDALTINVQRSGASARECRVDNYFVDAFPEVVMTETGGGESGWCWSGLRCSPALLIGCRKVPLQKVLGKIAAPWSSPVDCRTSQYHSTTPYRSFVCAHHEPQHGIDARAF